MGNNNKSRRSTNGVAKRSRTNQPLGRPEAFVSEDLKMGSKTGNHRQPEVTEMPLLIPLICFVQVLLHFTKTPNREILFLQFDPIKRYQGWRYATPFLIHDGQGDGSSPIIDVFHLWTNMFYHFLFGWRLEKVLKAKQTAVVYASSVICASLLSSTLKPCSFSVGSSDAAYGLMMANVVVHYTTPNKLPGWLLKFSGLTLLCELISPLLPEIFGTDNAAHFGGAFGGAFSSLILIHSFSVSGQFRRFSFKPACYLITMLFCIVTVAINLLYGHDLTSIPFTNDDVETHVRDGKYEMFAKQNCMVFWGMREFLWPRCPMSNVSSLTYLFGFQNYKSV